MLASTRSPASFSSSSFGPYNGDLGNAIRPVLVDSRIPKGAISFMKESIRVGLADLENKLAHFLSLPIFDQLTLPQCSCWLKYPGPFHQIGA